MDFIGNSHNALINIKPTTLRTQHIRLARCAGAPHRLACQQKQTLLPGADLSQQWRGQQSRKYLKRRRPSSSRMRFRCALVTVCVGPIGCTPVRSQRYSEMTTQQSTTDCIIAHRIATQLERFPDLPVFRCAPPNDVDMLSGRTLRGKTLKK